MIKLDANNTGNDKGFTQIEKGEYEVYPTAFEASVSQAGNPRVQFNYIVRDDVDQKFGGREIRYDNFTMTDSAMWRVNQASKAAGLDMTKEFADAAAWAAEFKNKAVRVYVDLESRNGKTYPVVKNFKPSEIGGERSEAKETANDPFQIDVSSDDLPF